MWREPGPFRLIGVGLSDLVPEARADMTGDLLDPDAARRAKAERAADRIRERFGADAIVKGALAALEAIILPPPAAPGAANRRYRR